MSQVALTWGIPLYPQSNLSKESIFKQTKGEETKRSIGLRITVVALGAIAVIIGSLMVSGVIHQWGAIAGGSIIAVGGGLMLVGILMKEVKHNSKKQSHSQSADSESPKIKQTSKKAAQKGKQSNTSNKGKGKTASKTGGQVNNSKKKTYKGR